MALVVLPVPDRSDNESAPDVDWTVLLRQSRVATGLSRVQVAQRANISAESLRAYETGRRRPTRAALDAVLDTLAVDPARRNDILRGAKLAADATFVGQQADQPDYDRAEATAYLDSLPWPAHLNSESFEVLAANRLMQQVWGADLEGEFPDPVDRNMVSVLSSTRFGDRLANWDEAVGMFASMVKGGYGEGSILDGGSNAYLAAVIERFLAGEPRYVQRFLRVWDAATPNVQKWRFTYPVHWSTPGQPTMRFMVIVSPANFTDYMTFNEWIPTDATTWSVLDG